MSADQGPGIPLSIQPVVSYPPAMTPGQRHFVEVDLNVAPGPWPWRDEEFAFTCMLDGGDQFSVQAVHDPSVVVHRFGGSYGPTRFAATPLDETGKKVLWLTIVSPRGIPVKTYDFKVDVLDRPADLQGSGPETGPQTRVRPFSVDPATEPGEYTEPEPVVSDSPLMAATSADVADVGLDEEYDLVALNQTRSGKIELRPIPLFARGATAGQRTELSIRFGPSDELGTVFPVVARPPTEGRFRVVSLQAVKVPPGTYQMAASLAARDKILFSGLPAPFRPVERNYQSIIATVPRWAAAGPVHLILAIEISGTPELVTARVAAADRLVNHVAESAGQARFSVISYGPHAIGRLYPEVERAKLAWADSREAAERALDRLYEHGGTQAGYTRAAQIECVLADLHEMLDTWDERHVLVTIGSRPAHPARVDPSSEIIPCRRRRDWRRAIDVLERDFPSIAFGAINESEQAGRREPMWRELGRDARAGLRDFDERRFAALLPFPSGPLPQPEQEFALPLLTEGSLLRSAEPRALGARSRWLLSRR